MRWSGLHENPILNAEQSASDSRYTNQNAPSSGASASMMADWLRMRAHAAPGARRDATHGASALDTSSATKATNIVGIAMNATHSRVSSRHTNRKSVMASSSLQKALLEMRERRGKFVNLLCLFRPMAVTSTVRQT